jgi:glycosyltransferase involved in cell wall biosynthesis
MKVLITTGIYPPDIGGPATYSKLLFEELPKKSIGTDVLSFGKVRWLPKGIRHIAYFFLILLNARDVDIIYAQDPVSVGLPSLYASRILKKKLYLKIVGDYAWEQASGKYSLKESLDSFSEKDKDYSFFIRLLKKIQTKVAGGAEKIIVPSNYLSGIVTNWGIEKEKITVIYNSFEKQEYRLSKESIKKLIKFEGELVVSVGRLVPWKGFAELIKIWPEILEKYPRAKLLIIGDGLLKKSLLRLRNSLSLSEDEVTLTGSIPQDILIRYLKMADTFILNTFYEGFSHVLLEALSQGTPVITTCVGGNTEVITHEKNGLIIKYNNKNSIKKAILRVLDNKEFGLQLGKEGERSVSKFSRERMINELIKLFV